MTKETSDEIATIAARVLNMEAYDGKTKPSMTDFQDLLTQAKKLAGSALSQREIIQAQIDGEDIFVLGERHEIKYYGTIGGYEIHATVEGGLSLRPLPQAEPKVEQSNFDLYVDGYTMKGTDKIGEILVTAPDGANVVLKSSQLTAFLERRLSPFPLLGAGSPE